MSIVLWMSANVDCSVGILSIVLADVGVTLTVVVLSVVEEVLKECRCLVNRPSGCWRRVDSKAFTVIRNKLDTTKLLPMKRHLLWAQ